jgi:hypothetical protein
MNNDTIYHNLFPYAAMLSTMNSGERDMWLIEHFGRYGIDWYYTYYVNSTGAYITYMFAAMEDYTQFLLTWMK